MSLIIAFKILAAPALIVGVTVLIRRGGPAAGGLAMGIPLTTGPISLFTAIEQGPEFARQATTGSLVGQVSTCLFCFTYALCAARANAWLSAAAGIAAFLGATVLWNQFSWSLAPAASLLIAGLLVMTAVMAKPAARPLDRLAPWWDLPLRMCVAACFVVTITTITTYLGAQLTGLIAPFPVFVLIIAVFCHLTDGSAVTITIMRGVVLGSLAFATFFTVTAISLTRLDLWAAYLMATLSCLTVSGLVYLISHRPIRRWPWTPSR